MAFEEIGRERHSARLTSPNRLGSLGHLMSVTAHGWTNSKCSTQDRQPRRGWVGCYRRFDSDEKCEMTAIEFCLNQRVPVLENCRIWIPRGHRRRYCRWDQVFLRATAGMPVRFKGSFDYQFVRTMGCVVYDRAAIGECYEPGSRIARKTPKRFESWCVTARGLRRRHSHLRFCRVSLQARRFFLAHPPDGSQRSALSAQSAGLTELEMQVLPVELTSHRVRSMEERKEQPRGRDRVRGALGLLRVRGAVRHCCRRSEAELLN
jgi:hypothetical protein